MTSRTPLRGRTVDLSRPIALADGELLLSFDDGPDALTTDVLATLERFDVTAVFFMIGNSVAAYPDIARKVRAAGHLVGSHTVSHPHLPELSATDAEVEVVDGHAMLAETLKPDRPHALFRFPYVEPTAALAAMVESHGLHAIGVDIVTRDWEPQTAEHLLGFALTEVDRIGSGIVLMHDIHRHTAAALGPLLEAVAARGHRIVTPVMA